MRSIFPALLVGSALAGGMLPLAPAAEPGSPTINLAEPPASLNTSPMPVEVVLAYPNLRIDRPVVVTGAADGSGRLFIASQQGQIYVIDESDTQVEEPELFIDLSDRVSYKDRENEEGFLGLAFHPKFAENGQFYVYYTTNERPHVSIISQFKLRGDGSGQGDPKSEKKLLEIQQPFWNHNGGTLVFGPDNYLYIGLGDGGKANDPLLAGQDLSKLLGSILRIDVDRTEGDRAYAIPADNPFAGRENVWPEIYASGLRNVWRMSFDPKTGTLWAADVGQNLWEEVNIIVPGGNYGWSLREAGHRFTVNGEGAGPSEALIDPLIEYPHTEEWGKSVTGGAVYRGKATPELDGYYLYGDYVSGRLWALKYDAEQNQVTENRPIAWSQLPVFTFGQTDSGEVLMTTMTSGGRIYKFVAKQ
ncbi:PQQ-dependent sugar dehydrogenase [Candidatus Laterigemmans baculatus]|uniref:PQQ-dependent sugar dehydrogenase n=1 Tax=Candidatus Laterigemmans baculatus TaxID=2770505 RepID=UPI0013DCFB62|nr:PQQ-dependent sugar dehydrogenase [Candidatus Laterigemmans baculatus]